MRLLLLILTTAITALAIGLGSAWFMVAEPRTGTLRIGAWSALPAVDAEAADPYLRARIARTGEIAMGAGEGLEFVAEVDEAGRNLRGGCDYLVSGLTPSARLWTLVAVDEAGRPAANAAGRNHLHSRDLLRDAGGRFEVAVSPSARPGNWLPAPAAGPIKLILRLYDTPTTLTSSNATVLPRVERRECR